MINLNNLNTFVNSYFAHPFWSAAKVDDAWIRLTFSYSDYFKEVAIANKQWTEKDAKEHWHLTDKVFKRSDCLEGKLGAYVKSANSKFLHSYYSLNVIPSDFGIATSREGREGEAYIRRAKAEHVSNILFIGIDWDVLLPCGPSQVFLEAGILPWAIIQTSFRDRIKRYQALIAVSPEDSREYARIRKLAVDANFLMGADLKVVDANRVFRLPGTINWKGANKSGKHSGHAMILEHNEGVTSAVYRCADIEAKLREFQHTDLSKLLRRTAGQINRVRFDERQREGRREPRLFELTWKEALEKAQKGEVSAKEGERHTAMVSWAGGISISVMRGELSLEEGEEVLLKLAELGCEGGFQEERAEVEGVIRYLRECSNKDIRRRDEEIERLIEGLDGGTSASEPLTKKELLTEEEKEAVDKHESSRTYIERITHALDAICKHSSEHETEEEYRAWLVQCFQCLKNIQSNPAVSNEFVKLLLNRLEKLKVLQDIGVFIPAFSKTLWGVEVSTLMRLNRVDVKTLINAVLTELLAMFNNVDGKKRKGGGEGKDGEGHEEGLRLDKEPFFAEVRRELAERAREDALEMHNNTASTSEMNNLEGSDREEGNYVEVRNMDKEVRLLRKYIRDYFKLKITVSVKKTLVEEVCNAVVAFKQPEGFFEKDTHTIYFQNGEFDLRESCFRPGEAWKRSRYGVYTSFDVECARRFKEEVLSKESSLGSSGVTEGVHVEDSGNVVSGGEGERGGFNDIAFEEFLSRELPVMTDFLRSAFPDDVRSWASLLCVVGYSLVAANPHQVFFGFHGPTGTGKTTMAELISELVGSMAYGGLAGTMRFDELGAEKGGLAHCEGKLVMVVGEAQTVRKENYERSFTALKNVTGATRATRVEQKYEHSRDAVIKCKFILCSNKPYEFKDEGGAVERRFIMFVFEHPPAPGKVNYTLIQDVVNDCRKAGANKLATIGAMLCQRRFKLGREMFNISGSKAREKGIESLRESVNPLKAIMEQVIEEEAGKSVPIAVLRAAIEVAAEKMGIDDIELIGIINAGGNRFHQQITGCLRGMGIKYDSQKDIKKVAIKNRRVSLRVLQNYVLSRAKLGALGVDVKDVFKRVSEEGFPADLLS